MNRLAGYVRRFKASLFGEIMRFPRRFAAFPAGWLVSGWQLRATISSCLVYLDGSAERRSWRHEGSSKSLKVGRVVGY